MDFGRMSNSKTYNDLLEKTSIQRLTDKYQFHGYLGHQDFFTLLGKATCSYGLKITDFVIANEYWSLLGINNASITGVEYPDMFYLLDCSWNRQLDTSWKSHYGSEIFQLYHRCPEPIRIYHGNGGNSLPAERIKPIWNIVELSTGGDRFHQDHKDPFGGNDVHHVNRFGLRQTFILGWIMSSHRNDFRAHNGIKWSLLHWL